MLNRIREAPKEVWDTLAACSQLKMSTQKEMMTPQYFNNVKSLCHQISELDPTTKFAESTMKMKIICGLRPELRGLIAEIQDWPIQPSLVELKNLLANQKSLAKRMTRVSPKSEEEQKLFSHSRRSSSRQNNSRIRVKGREWWS